MRSEANSSGQRAPRILLIEDDDELRSVLAGILRKNGYVVDAAFNATGGLTVYAERGADLVLLDMTLPDHDGRAVLESLRRHDRTPVIVVTGRTEEQHKVEALDAGANDYVTKPFGVAELLARIRAQLRTIEAEEPPVPYLDDGFLRIDLANRTVTVGGNTVALTPKEYGLLAMLARNTGRVVPQSQLLRELWGPTYEQDTHYLRILVGKLRQKLGDDATAPRWIATETGVGLRLLLSV